MAFRTSQIAFATSLLLLGLHTAHASEEAAIRGDSPEITLQKLQHNFGNVYRGQVLQHSFTIKNTGKAALDLRSIHAGCGCINTQVKPRTRLSAGEEGKLTYDLDTSWFSGALSKTITVDSNDPEHATTILEVEANVKEEIRAVPAVLTLGEMDKTSPNANMALNIEILEKASGKGTSIAESKLAKIPVELAKIKDALRVDASETKILAITASSPDIVLASVPTPKGMRVSVTFKTPLPSGPFRERITVWNTSTHLKELIIPVVGEITQKTRLSNSYIEFGTVRPNARSKRSVMVSSRFPGFKIESVQVDVKKTDALKSIATEDIILASITDTGVTVDLRNTGKLNLSGTLVNVSGAVLVRTNDPDAKELRIPFFAVLTEESEP